MVSPRREGRFCAAFARSQDRAHASAGRGALTTAIRDGSWWTAWTDWLGQRSGEPVMPPPLGRADSKFVLLGDAPGQYVLMT